MMPSPVPGASHGAARSHPNEQPEPPEPPRLAHLVCHCQLHADPRLTLCGLDVSGDPAAFAARVGAHACVVCVDLARTAFVARRCQRCPS